MPAEPKKLIEVAMPVKEISAESVRDKSIRHGHISTLHLWWARRPLPVCRAVVFASLVPDPLDENCPREFVAAVEELLGKKNNPGDPYKPYTDIPFTAAIDPMEDNLRNRLLMFIGKFSDTYIKNEKYGKVTPAKDQLSEYSLIKWDNKNNETIINKARRLIWVAHDPAHNTLAEFDKHYQAIKKAEQDLYSIPDRHIETDKVKTTQAALDAVINAFQERMPSVFDPFAGGGAIPLEAARLGCRTYANDLNPVAHIIEKGSLEFPQKYGKPINYSTLEFVKRYGQEAFDALENDAKVVVSGSVTGVRIANRLAYDVEFYAKKLLALAEQEIGRYYPADEQGNRPVAYYWARTIKCSNPTCQFEIPLVGTKFLCRKTDKKVAFNLLTNEKEKSFDIIIKKDRQIDFNTDGTVSGSKAICPHCQAVNGTDYLKNISKTIGLGQKLIAVIWETDKGKEYRLPTKADIEASQINTDLLHNQYLPNESMQQIPDLVSGRGWGIEKWRDLFSTRQLLAMQTLVSKLGDIKTELNPQNDEYAKAIVTYLGILINRISSRQTSFGLWHISGEKLEQPFGRQAIPMVFDYPESNLFCNSSGSALNQIDWLIRYINGEGDYSFSVKCNNSSSGEITQFPEKSLQSVITDPPYYDAIAYADLSDFFYVWLKRTLGDLFSIIFAFPQTPKGEECTALKHHHNDNVEQANYHFEKKLLQIFDTIEKQTNGVVSIMFAHQSTQAWSTLCNSILNARMNITSSWAIDTEMPGALKTNKAFLASSVTVSCRPSVKSGFGVFKEIKQAIEEKVRLEVKNLYKLGFRGADLLTACFGQAVSVFGQYERVEKADGSTVTVAELLELARDAAFNAIVSDIDTDDATRFYIGWLHLFGFTQAAHDDVRRITQIGLNIDVNDLLKNNILLRDKNNEALAAGEARIQFDDKLGLRPNSYTIDKAHRAMHLFNAAQRGALVAYIREQAPVPESQVWRVLTSLLEILPSGSKDHSAAAGLLANKDSLLREALLAGKAEGEQTKLQL